MNILPIISRELRVEARRVLNHRLRVLAAAVSMLGLAVFITDPNISSSEIGIRMFSVMHVAVLIFALIMVPAIAADSLSREKRDGTLGLLFLTHLKSWEIVLAKAFVHLLQAGGCWLSALPVLIFPIVLGGLTWFDFVTAVTFQFAAIGLGLGVSMCVSARLLRRNPAFGLSIILSVMATWAIGFVMMNVLFWLIQNTRPGSAAIQDASLTVRLIAPVVLLLGYFDGKSWSSILSGVPWITNGTWYQLLAGLALTTLFCMIVFIRLAARLAEVGWRDRPRSVRQEKRRRLFFTWEFLKNFFRRRAGRLLDRNPIVWLQGYSVEARLVNWGFGLMCAIVLSGIVFGTVRFSANAFIVLTCIVLAGLAYGAATSFVEDRRSGALELILVTPIRERELILGRLLGLWGGFVPTLVLIQFGWFSLNSWNKIVGRGPATHGVMPENLCASALVSGWAFLPVIGLSLALRTKHVLVAWCGTVLIWILPVLFFRMADVFPWWPSADVWMLRFLPVLLIGLALWHYKSQSRAPVGVMLTAWLLGAFLMSHLVPADRLAWERRSSYPFEIVFLVVAYQAGIAAIFLSLLHRGLRQRRFVIDGGMT